MIAVVDKQGRTVAEACRALPPDFCGSVLEPGRGAIGLAIESRKTVGILDYQKFDKALPEVRGMGACLRCGCSDIDGLRCDWRSSVRPYHAGHDLH